MNYGPYHDGELEIQRKTGESEQAERNSVVIKDFIIGGAIDFISRQTLIVVGTESADGNLWASIVFGKSGFIVAPNSKEVCVDLTQAQIAQGDPLLSNLKETPGIGALLIELETRRRLKINGQIVKRSEDKLIISVDESFPLCPKYIQRRRVWPAENCPDSIKFGGPEPAVFRGEKLGDKEIALIRAADTMFCATAYPKGRLDVSHRGGSPGFVSVLNQSFLRIPDYYGNGMFSSFGNLQGNSRAGLVFIDFSTRQTLQISGNAMVLFEEEDPENETGGTKRFWTLDIDFWQRSILPGLEVAFLDYSPFNPTLR